METGQQQSTIIFPRYFTKKIFRLFPGKQFCRGLPWRRHIVRPGGQRNHRGWTQPEQWERDNEADVEQNIQRSGIYYSNPNPWKWLSTCAGLFLYFLFQIWISLYYYFDVFFTRQRCWTISSRENKLHMMEVYILSRRRIQFARFVTHDQFRLYNHYF